MHLSRARRMGVIAALACGTLPTPARTAEGPGPVLVAVRDRSAAAGTQESQLERMNPFILTNLVSTRIVVEVDWVEGYVPAPEALQAIAAVLREHGEPGKRVDLRPDDGIPRSDWGRAQGRTGLEGLVARYLDGDPGDWGRAELIYVLYVPDSRPWYGENVSGMSDRVTFSRAGTLASVRTILLFTDEIRRNALLWITPAKIERATLVHELGHVIGLVSNPTHALAQSPDHCTVARCVMHRPGPRAGFVNGLTALFGGRIPTRFGKHCVEDIEMAKRQWRARASASPEFARRLRAERLLREATLVERRRARHAPE